MSEETFTNQGDNDRSTNNDRGRGRFRGGRSRGYDKGRGRNDGQSGCPNHMTGTKSLFKVLDESQKINVQLENKRDMQVEGKGKQVHVHMTPNKMFQTWRTLFLLQVQRMTRGYDI